MLTDLTAIASDLVAITAVAGIYFHRHQRRDLLLAYVALNAGILAVTTVLTSATVGAGLGLGLFGILSIIRLRSDGITQEEIAYYFIALALGLLAGVDPGPAYTVPLLCGLLVVVMYVADHPALFSRARRQLLTLDAAIPQEASARAHIEARLGVEVRHLIVQEVDFVRDLTIVDVRFRIAPAEGTTPGHREVDENVGLGIGGHSVAWQPPLPERGTLNNGQHAGLHTTTLRAGGPGQEAPGP